MGILLGLSDAVVIGLLGVIGNNYQGHCDVCKVSSG